MHHISIRNESGRRTRLSTLRRALETLLERYEVPLTRIDVLVTTDARMRELNKEFRAVDEATDVLTFPGPDWDGAPLGDIAISMEFAQRGAVARRVAVHEELACLAVHGGLHLLGFDDESETGRADMVRRMNEVLRLAGVHPDEGWASQPHGPHKKVQERRG
jgi:probable rRNA maturation factor